MFIMEGFPSFLYLFGVSSFLLISYTPFSLFLHISPAGHCFSVFTATVCAFLRLMMVGWSFVF